VPLLIKADRTLAVGHSRSWRELDRFIPGNTGMRNDRDSRAPGNAFPSSKVK